MIEGIDDERAVTLLHAANYFTRALTVTERAAATEALRGDAVPPARPRTRRFPACASTT